MEQCWKYENKEFSADTAWKMLQLSVFELKRVLDKNKPFDFLKNVKSSRVLLVGEGNLSFSLALARLAGSAANNMTSTTFQSAEKYSETARNNAKILQNMGVTVLAKVDATNLFKAFGKSQFDLIIFQFPNVGSRSPLYKRNPNHVLIRRFLHSAADQLTIKGKVVITAINSPYYDGAFDVNSAAKYNGYELPVAYPFYFLDYPGYTHVKTKDDGTSVADSDHECVTYVFKRKIRADRKWILR